MLRGNVPEKLDTMRSVRTGYCKQVSELTNALLAASFLVSTSVLLTLPSKYYRQEQHVFPKLNLEFFVCLFVLEKSNINKFWKRTWTCTVYLYFKKLSPRSLRPSPKAPKENVNNYKEEFYTQWVAKSMKIKEDILYVIFKISISFCCYVVIVVMCRSFNKGCGILSKWSSKEVNSDKFWR